MTDDYRLVPEFPDPETYVALRDAAGMPPRSLAAAERGVPNTTFGVRVVFDGGDRDGDADVARGGDDSDELVVGMGRLVGDGGTVFQVVDVAVHPDHQGRGLGTRVMDALVDYLDREAPPSAFVNLLADVDGYYERWGFEPTAPASKGMFLRVGEDGVRGRDER
ncbi:N-acetyltransferase [Haloferax sp. Atlit-10N]|uniref:GNAT family N-acetyltransferase n=1 Tax=Haloferax TaxID=2251 RepID=UPI000679E517|nr:MULTISPECIES: GNAT family N-acetyltransferase [Haloferax]RDZ44279.1 N-acetyltransferase [Haloferax sp. Atlit-16N]RDZ58323.1 N-acetyltransferase [Haloferax sp. Atlit-10N]REA03360.1 N-acetyltransferase [Haloferax sp. Atlit-6N]